MVRDDVSFRATLVRGVAHVPWGSYVGGDAGFGGEIAERFEFRGGKFAVAEMGLGLDIDRIGALYRLTIILLDLVATCPMESASKHYRNYVYQLLGLEREASHRVGELM